MTLLRDLTHEEFQERYSCDRFTATVLASRFGYVVERPSRITAGPETAAIWAPCSGVSIT